VSISEPVRLAMWSGPRNISTAMMRAWENRSDTTVWDEPLYAYYLQESGSDHPGREEVIAAGEPRWQRVVELATGRVPEGKRIHFQKHMTHHLLTSMDWDWLGALTNCFLIRDPREVIASYIKTRPNVTIEDVGIPQQAAIFEHVTRLTGKQPLVLDAKDVLRNPEVMLRALCDALGVEFDAAMLSWPAGLRGSDGIWARYWYDSVRDSTGFVSYESKAHLLPAEFETLARHCAPHYEALWALRLKTV